MQNKWVINVLLIIIMILVVVACIITYMCLKNDVEIIELPKQEALFVEDAYPKVDGTIEMLPLAEAFKANFIGKDIKDVEVKHSNTQNAYVNLINGGTDLILVPYPSKVELDLAKSKGIELEIVPIVKDAFVFFVNKNNPVEDVSLEQIQEIYSGKIRNWKELEGHDKEILAYQKTENSRSQQAMLEFVMKQNKIMKPKTQTVHQEMSDIVDVIQDYNNSENAIGYAYSYYYEKMYTKDSMKLLSIDGIKPTYENIQTGLYNFQKTYYAVIRKDESENSNTRKLLNAMMSSEGQNIAKEAGYVQNY